MSKRGSLVRQGQQQLHSMLAVGESRHAAKAAGTAADRIYSWSTYHTYVREWAHFARAVKAEHPELRDWQQARQHVGEYLQRGIDAGRSPSTIRTQASALAKVYRCGYNDFGTALPSIRSAPARRSRGEALRDRHFAALNNRDLVEFAKCTGLRRSELAAVRGSDIGLRDGQIVVHVERGKGGRQRDAVVIGSAAEQQRVVGLCQRAGDSRVFARVHSAMDVHAYRHAYAQQLYEQLARDYSACRAAGELYHCRGSNRGVWLDRSAVIAVSEALGHSRLDVAIQYIMSDVSP